MGRGSPVGIATELRAGRSEDRIPVEGETLPPVQTGPWAHPASCIMSNGSCPREIQLCTRSIPVPYYLYQLVQPLSKHCIGLGPS